MSHHLSFLSLSLRKIWFQASSGCSSTNFHTSTGSPSTTCFRTWGDDLASPSSPGLRPLDIPAIPSCRVARNVCDVEEAFAIETVEEPRLLPVEAVHTDMRKECLTPYPLTASNPSSTFGLNVMLSGIGNEMLKRLVIAIRNNFFDIRHVPTLIYHYLPL